MFALLDDIINLALDSKQPLPDILRKCLLLGHELGVVTRDAAVREEC